MTTDQPKKLHFNALTGIRAIAAIMIFVYHNRKYWKDDLHPELFRLCNEFNLGVQLFFILSGFLIAKSYGSQPLQSARHFKKYFLQRIIRIMPLYWLLLTLYYLDASFGNFHFSIINYLLLQGFSVTHSLDAISQSWSLTVEMTFYAFAPVLMLLLQKKLAYLIGFLVVLYGAAVIVGLVWTSYLGNPNSYLHPANFVLMSTFFGQSILFASGMFLAHYPNFWNRLPLSKYATTLGAIGFVLIVYIIGLFQESRVDHGTNHWQGKLLFFTLLPFFVVLLFHGLMNQKTYLQRFLSSKIMVLLGNASFAFYLIHISYANLKLKSWIFLSDRNFVLLWIVSIALYYGFEKPVYAWYKRKS
ncbi:acyltransferase [Flavobacterium sp. SUN052]|uniref:acyltransferase family protein n=1 Tax=Flavobacterium sp. SUN052 TaxID=3002441 RepID=UPI00237DFA73|nr:acyltransferase [Flavobacterium sp. SUN052]MEC4005626.1 acyltransferase [Flavobacterium sp. SUN052]